MKRGHKAAFLGGAGGCSSRQLGIHLRQLETQRGRPVPREHCVWVQLPLLALLDGLGISLKPPETSRQSQVTIANGSGEFG